MPDSAEEAAALPQVNLTQLRREHGWPAASGPKRRGATQLGTDSMGYLAWIVVGAVAGFLASVVMRTREDLLMMVVLGIVGGLVGGYVATTLLKLGSVNGINVESILIATAGAVVVLLVANSARGRRHSWR
jgi:uncharacterized membrane protein YeaQ/YmgE (transglycosylase-associated protein family)